MAVWSIYVSCHCLCFGFHCVYFSMGADCSIGMMTKAKFSILYDDWPETLGDLYVWNHLILRQSFQYFNEIKPNYTDKSQEVSN